MGRAAVAAAWVGRVTAGLLATAPPAAADHFDDGTYRCDGGWCSDGREHVLDCGGDGDGCTGDTGGFATIRNPAFGDGAWLADDDWVIGITLQGESKAYPVRVISGQQGWEMVTDEVGGHPVVVTYCPLCGSPIAYSRLVDGRALDFLNTGAIWRNDLVMFDRGTGSQWSQVAGEALAGVHHGESLDLVPQQVARWAAWRDAHPDGVAMARPAAPDGGDLCRCPPFSGGAMSWVTGAEVDGVTVAFRHQDVPPGSTAEASVDGRVVQASNDNGTLTLRVVGGQEPLATRTLWESRWNVFFDDTLWGTAVPPATEATGDPDSMERSVPGGPVAGAVAAVVVMLSVRRRSAGR